MGVVKIMPSIGLDEEDDNPGFVSPLNDDLVYRGFSYFKLPQQLLNLCILKLDGSSFDVHVARNATIAELKQAIEELFSSSPKEGQGRISWSLVWGHFCLCYEGQKLLNDKPCIRTFGIKDGDQLQFIRHMSIDHEPLKRDTKNQTVACKQYSGLSSFSDAHEAKELTPGNNGSNNEDQEDNLKYYDYESDEHIPIPACKLAHFLRGRLSYARLQSVFKKGSNGRIHPSKFSQLCLGGGPGMIQL